MKLKCLSLSDLEQIRKWRNEQTEMLRTSFPLTKEMQEDFYKNVICNRQSNSRFWVIIGNSNKELDKDFYGKSVSCANTELIGMCGLENIQWENRLAEISLILEPEYNDDNLQKALNILLHEGFANMNLENIYTEVYECSYMHRFWIESANKYNAKLVILPNRKYWNGKYYDSEYINFNKERYNENIIS